MHTEVDLVMIDKATYDEVLKEKRVGLFKRDAAIMILREKTHVDRTKDDIRVLDALIEENEFFRTLDLRIRSELCKQMTYVCLEPNETLFRQGEESDAFFLILAGQVGVYIKQQLEAQGKQLVKDVLVATIHEGGTFGEWGLQQEQPRTATIKSFTPCELVRIGKQEYEYVLREHRQQAWKLDAAVQIVKSTKPGRRTDEDLRKLLELIRSKTAFHDYSQELRIGLCQHLEHFAVTGGETIFRQGDAPDFMYILVKGDVQVWHNKNLKAWKASVVKRKSAAPPEFGKVGENASKAINDPRASTTGPAGAFATTAKKVASSLVFKKFVGRVKDKAPHDNEDATSSEGEALSASSSMQAKRGRRNTALVTKDEYAPGLQLWAPLAQHLKALGRSKPSQNQIARLQEFSRMGSAKTAPKGERLSALDISKGKSQVREEKATSVSAQNVSQTFGQAFTGFSQRIESKMVPPKVAPEKKAPREAGVGIIRRADGHGEEAAEKTPKKTQPEAANVIVEDPKKGVIFNAGGGGAAEGEEDDEEDDASKDDSKSNTCIAELKEGDVFGEQGFLTNDRRSATIKTLGNCELLGIDRDTFTSLMRSELMKKQAERMQFLRRWLPAVEELPQAALEKLTLHFRDDRKTRGALLCIEGDEREQNTDGDRLKVIVEGQAKVVRGGLWAQKAAKKQLDGLGVEGSAAFEPTWAQRGGMAIETLLPGQIVNASSQLLSETEPFTVIVDSAEMLLVSIANVDLVNRTPQGIVEGLRATAELQRHWRSQRSSQLDTSPALDLALLSPPIVVAASGTLLDSPFLRWKHDVVEASDAAGCIVHHFRKWIPPELRAPGATVPGAHRSEVFHHLRLSAFPSRSDGQSKDEQQLQDSQTLPSSQQQSQQLALQESQQLEKEQVVERESQHSAQPEEQQPDRSGAAGASEGIKGHNSTRPSPQKPLDPKQQAVALALSREQEVDMQLQRREENASEQTMLPTAVKLEHALSLRGKTLKTDLSFQEVPPEMTETIHMWRCAGRKPPPNMGPRGRPGPQSPKALSTSLSKREGPVFSIEGFRDGSGSIDGIGSLSETGRNCDSWIGPSLIESTKDVVEPQKIPAVGSTSRASTHAPSGSRLPSSQGTRKLTSASPSWGSPSVPATPQARRPKAPGTAPGGPRSGALPPLTDNFGSPPHSAPAQSSGGGKRASSEKPRRRPSVADAIWWPEGTPWHQSTLGGSCPGPHWEGSSIAPMGTIRDLGITVPATPPVLTQRGALVLSVDCIDPLMITSASAFYSEDVMSNASGDFGDGLGEPWASRHSHGVSTDSAPLRRSLVMEGQDLDTWDSVFATEVSKGDSMTDPLNAGDSLEGYLSSQRMRVEGAQQRETRTPSRSPRRVNGGTAALPTSPRHDASPRAAPVGPPDQAQLEELTRIFGVFESVQDHSRSEALPPMPSMEQSTMVSEDSVWDQMRSIMSSIDEVNAGISRELREEMSLFTEGDAHATLISASQISPPPDRPFSRSIVRPPRSKLRAKDPFRPKPPPSEGAAINALAISQSTFSAQSPTLQVHSINKFLAKDGGRCDPTPKRRPLRKPPKPKASADAPEVENQS
jgi:CRP-like cAMP-binding protein